MLGVGVSWIGTALAYCLSPSMGVGIASSAVGLATGGIVSGRPGVLGR